MKKAIVFQINIIKMIGTGHESGRWSVVWGGENGDVHVTYA